jgi:hypothetical protein
MLPVSMMQTAVACSATTGDAKEFVLIVWQQTPEIPEVLLLSLAPVCLAHSLLLIDIDQFSRHAGTLTPQIPFQT